MTIIDKIQEHLDRAADVARAAQALAEMLRQERARLAVADAYLQLATSRCTDK